MIEYQFAAESFSNMEGNTLVFLSFLSSSIGRVISSESSVNDDDDDDQVAD